MNPTDHDTKEREKFKHGWMVGLSVLLLLLFTGHSHLIVHFGWAFSLILMCYAWYMKHTIEKIMKTNPDDYFIIRLTIQWVIGRDDQTQCRF